MKQPHQVYRITIDSLPTAAKIEAEFEVVLAQIAAFTPTTELTRAIFEEMVTRITRRISFKINEEAVPMGVDGKHGSVMKEIGMTFLDGGENKGGCNCTLVAGIDTQKEGVVGIVTGCKAGVESSFQALSSEITPELCTAAEHGNGSTLIKPEWANKAQDTLKGLLYNSASHGNIKTSEAEKFADFVLRGFLSLDEQWKDVTSFPRVAIELSERSHALQRRIFALHSIITGERFKRNCGSEYEAHRTQAGFALERFGNVSEDLKLISWMIDEIEATLAKSGEDWAEVLDQRNREVERFKTIGGDGNAEGETEK